jgi:hypothetical protein
MNNKRKMKKKKKKENQRERQSKVPLEDFEPWSIR